MQVDHGLGLAGVVAEGGGLVGHERERRVGGVWR